MGVTQHHDSIAGTARQEVNDDYSLLLEGGRADAFAGLVADFATATGYSAAENVADEMERAVKEAST